MAIEAASRALGAPAELLHTARSRNDQVALDLRLHVRERCARDARGARRAASAMLADARTRRERRCVLPAYTHRQRASRSAGVLAAAATPRRSRAMSSARLRCSSRLDALPLGVGALAGTSLPIDRELVRELLGFSRLTANGLDTVGDRDFALDSPTRPRGCSCTPAARDGPRRLPPAEFGFLQLDGDIACGSSMMPQKKKPGRLRAGARQRPAGAVGDLIALLVTVKGLPGGYNRDLQEDRDPVLQKTMGDAQNPSSASPGCAPARDSSTVHDAPPRWQKTPRKRRIWPKRW